MQRRILLAIVVIAIAVTSVVVISPIYEYMYTSKWLEVEPGYAAIIKTKSGLRGPIIGSYKGYGIDRWAFWGTGGYEESVMIYIDTDSVSMWMGNESDFPLLKVLSSDGLDITIDLLIRWSILEDKVVALYENYPMMNWKDKTIASVARDQARSVVSTYTAVEIIERRPEVVGKIVEACIATISNTGSLEGALKNIEVEVRDIDPPESFTQAVEAKLTAQQDRIKAEFEKEKTIIQAQANKEAAIIAAQAEAQKSILEAEGIANATIIKAESQKEAIALLVSVTGTDNETVKAELAKLWMQLDTQKMIWGEMAKNINTLYLFLVNGEDGRPVFLQLPVPQDTQP